LVRELVEKGNSHTDVRIPRYSPIGFNEGECQETYVVVNKLNQEVAPNDTYSDTVIRGAISCGLSREYCQQLLSHMTQLQRKIG
jgi:cation transport regulator ChaC